MSSLLCRSIHISMSDMVVTMMYIVTTWETMQSRYEVEAADKNQAWEFILDNKGKQVEKIWAEDGSYVVELKDTQDKPKFPGNVVDFKQKVLEIMKQKKPIDKE